MVLLDDHGRVLGWINVIDLIAALVAVACLPLAYVSWTRIHTPQPVIEAVIPPVIGPGENARIPVRGRNLRPFLRANIGTLRTPFLFESPDRAQVQVPPLPAGVYDLAFFDAWKEIARFPNAVHVTPGTPLDVHVRFVTRPEILAQLQRSRGEAGGADPQPNLDPARPVLLAYEVTGDRVPVVTGVVRLWATWTADGWQANGQAIRAGALLTLATPTYVMEGEILTVAVAHAAQ